MPLRGKGLPFVTGWTADKLLKGAGVGADPTETDVPTTTKELFIPANYGSVWGALGDGYLPRLYGAGHIICFVFQIPLDFVSLTSLEFIAVPSTTDATTMKVTFTSDYGALTESYNVHSATLTDQASVAVPTVDKINKWDI